MKTLEAFIQQVKAQVNEKGLKNVLELQPLMSRYTANDWNDYLNRENGVPKTTVLFENEEFKFNLVYWNPFQKTSKHGHAGLGGIFKILSGNLLETRFDPIRTDWATTRQRYFKNAIATINDEEAYHIVENTNKYPAVSLHLYFLKTAYIPKIKRQDIPAVAETSPLMQY